MFIEKNPNFTMYLIPIELIDLNLYQKFWIKNSKNKLPKLLTLTDVTLLKHVTLKDITEGNNVVLIEVVIMISARKHFIMRRKNKKAFEFFSSWKWFINYSSSWGKSITVYKNIQYNEKGLHIICRLTPITQYTYFNR